MYRKKCKLCCFHYALQKAIGVLKVAKKKLSKKKKIGILNYFVVSLSTNYCVHV